MDRACSASMNEQTYIGEWKHGFFAYMLSEPRTIGSIRVYSDE